MHALVIATFVFIGFACAGAVAQYALNRTGRVLDCRLGRRRLVVSYESIVYTRYHNAGDAQRAIDRARRS